MKPYRMETPCVDCPFNDDGPGRHLRDSLARGRWEEILDSLRCDQHFTCHKTSDETGDNSNLICAGSIAWQDENDYPPSQYLRICERLTGVAS